MRISIIGAGFSGCALATELARAAPEGVDIQLVGVPDSFGRGVAYGEARPEHLLNVRARDLGATADHPGEFADWLNLTDRARTSFLPRLVYGEYLTVDEILERIEAVSADDVRAVAAELAGRPRSLAVVGPFDEDATFGL